ncbi:glycosyltransferase family 4 protein [Calothrix sp. PCC 7507]|uniref:glycosyltransferase family 4 protein n=1 Tax=Calothrix sp. PCC 7507 TaxID=99598 RepID=UPI00029EE833|nr:glycosyltransferase family 4 protein [Calothrix sp. PCC 7507]AFY32577.1 glycosyl transferase group 1 [Calothrix sp. PCC 7507]
MKIIAYPAFKTKYKNPCNWLLYTNMLQQEVMVAEFSAKKLLSEKYDIFHLHWVVETIVRHPNSFIVWMRAISMLMLIDWAKSRGTRIIWTIHDENPHSILHLQIANWFQKEFIKRIDGYISLSTIGKNIAEKKLPELKTKPCCLVPHGHYRNFYPDQITSSAARALLNIPDNYQILLFFGYIDDYKNVPHLIKIFRELDTSNWLLVVAGKLESPHLKTEILSAAENDERVKLFLNYIPDDQVQLYFKAAKLVVLPFKEILNSGSALLALSFDCPILVPQLGAMPELQSQVGEDWIKLYAGELTNENLREGLNWSAQQTRLQSPPLDKLDWKISSQNIVDFYRLTKG